MKPKATRATKKAKPFTFTFEGKLYEIKKPYQAQAATLVLTDGKILQVKFWKVSSPFEAAPESVEPFDPEQQAAATLAEAPNTFLAELVEEK
jgi:hypothetical protein